MGGIGLRSKIMPISLLLLMGLVLFPFNVSADDEELVAMEMGNITVNHPEDWVGQGHINDIFFLVPTAVMGEEFEPNVNMILQPFEEEVVLEEFSEATLSELEKEVDEFELQEEEYISIDNREGKKLRYSGFLNEVYPDKIYWLQAFTVLEENVLLFTYTSPEELYSDFEDEVLKILQNLEIEQ